MVDLNVITTVLRKFLSNSRQPNYINKPEYKHMLEMNKEIYLSSAWFKHHWSWGKAKAYLKSMIEGKEYFICSLPYQLAIKEGLLNRKSVINEMSESDFNAIGWRMEMEALFYGESEKAYFKVKELQSCRKALKAIYPPTSLELSTNSKKKNNSKILKQDNEVRLLGVDIALIKSVQNENDNTVFTFMRLLPDGDQYQRQVLYIESMDGENTEDVAMRMKQLFYDFECDYCALDTAGSGIGVYDSAGRILYDKERDIEYPSWTCMNDDEKMKYRSNDPNALPVIYSIKASSELNHIIATSLKSCIEKGKIKLLVNEIEAKDYLIDNKNINYAIQDIETQTQLLSPYIQTSLLINEMVNLEAEMRSAYLRLTEVGRGRKDRYSSLAYVNLLANILEEDLIDYNEDDDLLAYLNV